MERPAIGNRDFPVFEKISFVLLCMLMANCCICGAGRMVMVGPFSVRMMLFGLSIVTAIPLMLKQWKTLLSNKILWAFAIWLGWLAVTVVIGLVKGNSLSVMITDLKGFAYFAILPVAVCLLSTRERAHTLMKVMMYASGMLGLLILFHFYLYLYNGKLFEQFYLWGIACRFSGISRVADTIPRLFFYSSNYLLVGCAFATYFQIVHRKIRWDLCLITGINLICLLMSYTRSIYLGVGVAILVLVIGALLFLGKTQVKKFWKHICLSVVAFCLVLSAFGIATKTDYVSYAVTRTLLSFETPPAEEIDPTTADTTKPTKPADSTKPTKPKPTDPSTQAAQSDTLQSDQLRGNIQKELLNMIKKYPVVGNGLGAAIDWRTSNEYFYLDLTAKTGVIGLVLYMLPMLSAAWLMFRGSKEKSEEKFLCAAWICVLLGFMAFSYFNPYMNAALGVLFYSCTLAAVSAVMKKKQ